MRYFLLFLFCFATTAVQAAPYHQRNNTKDFYKRSAPRAHCPPRQLTPLPSGHWAAGLPRSPGPVRGCGTVYVYRNRKPAYRAPRPTYLVPRPTPQSAPSTGGFYVTPKYSPPITIINPYYKSSEK